MAELTTIPDAAELTGIPVRRIRGWVAAGYLKTVRRERRVLIYEDAVFALRDHPPTHELSEQDRDTIAAQVAATPQLTPAQVDDLGTTLADIRLRRARQHG